VENLRSIELENVNFDVFALLDRCMSLPNIVLERVRLIGIHGKTENSDALGKIATLQGRDENGLYLPNAVVRGSCEMRVMYHTDLPVLQAMFPELGMSHKHLCVKFPDPEYKRLMKNEWDGNNNGEVDLTEAQESKVFHLSTKNNASIESIEGIEYLNYVDPQGYYSSQFENCKSLKVARFPESIIGTASNMFKGCTSLEEIRFSTNLSILRTSAFEGCSALRNVTIPPTVTEIGSNAFQATDVEQVVLPDSITTVGGGCFLSCSSLTEFDFGNGSISSMGSYIFQDCSKLKKVTFGSNVQAIGQNLFNGNVEVETIIIKNPVPPSVGYIGLGYYGTIYVPDGAVETYKSATYFSGSNVKGRIRPISELPV